MFKSVEYAGFDGEPELRRLAEQATGLLPAEVESFRNDVRVRWAADAGSPDALDLDLTLELSGGTGHAARRIATADFADDDELRYHLRRTWTAAARDYLNKRVAAWDEITRQPVEV